MSLQHLRLQSNGFFQFADRFRGVRNDQQRTQILMSIGKLRADIDCRTKRLFRFVVRSGLRINKAQIVVSLRIVWINPDRFFELRDDLLLARSG